MSDLDRELADLALNDLGNARRLIGRHGEDILSVDHIGWHVWDGKRFQREAGEAEALKRCFDTVDAMKAEAIALRDDPVLQAQFLEDDVPVESFENDFDMEAAPQPKRRRTQAEARSQKMHAYARTSGNAGKIGGMLKLASPLKRIAAVKLDAQKLAFTVGNGVLKLNPDAVTDASEQFERFRCVEFSRDDLGTKLASVEYVPGAKCPKFLKFLEQIQPNAEVRDFLQRWFGYCLTGDTSEQSFLVFFGKGSNGKSQLVIAIRAVMGDYASTSDIKTFLSDDKSNGANARPDIARLPGNRLVVASEPERGQALDESTIKTVTGGEMMATRKLFQDIFEFAPAFKLILSTNYKITIRGTDNGIWRRVLLVPFEQTFGAALDGSDEVKDIGAQLAAEEGPGILNWMLEGYAMWRDMGLAPPADIREATQEYREESDPVGVFLKECVQMTDDVGAQLATARLYDVYCKWCADVGRTPFKRNGFGRAITDRQIHRAKSSSSFYQGIRLTVAGYEYERAQGQGAPIGGDPRDDADGDPL